GPVGFCVVPGAPSLDRVLRRLAGALLAGVGQPADADDDDGGQDADHHDGDEQLDEGEALLATLLDVGVHGLDCLPVWSPLRGWSSALAPEVEVVGADLVTPGLSWTLSLAPTCE